MRGRFRLLCIDPGTLHVTDVIPAPRSDLGTDFTLDGNTIWWNGGASIRVDTRTSTIVATVRLTSHPDLFAGPRAIVTGGGSVWASIASATASSSQLAAASPRATR
jgi:hypothetical protein